MTKFRVLVVDDEPLARAAVAGIVKADPDVDAIDECGDGLAAREAIERDRPDIVFLDIEMPGLDGLRLADGLPPGGPVVVFTTAYSQYAAQAFDVAATDYVLKPFSRERLLASLARAKRRVRERRLGQLASEIVENGQAYLERLSLKLGDRTLVVSEDEVMRASTRLVSSAPTAPRSSTSRTCASWSTARAWCSSCPTARRSA
jgi:two-component system LytT family response regulator